MADNKLVKKSTFEFEDPESGFATIDLATTLLNINDQSYNIPSTTPVQYIPTTEVYSYTATNDCFITSFVWGMKSTATPVVNGSVYLNDESVLSLGEWLYYDGKNTTPSQVVMSSSVKTWEISTSNYISASSSGDNNWVFLTGLIPMKKGDVLSFRVGKNNQNSNGALRILKLVVKAAR